MGRFYKATPRTFVEDKMFEIPFQEMSGVMGKVDADIEKNEEAALALQDTLKLQALQNDSQYAKDKIAGYEGKIGDLVQNIYDDPLKFRGSSAQIRDLSRTIEKDFESGEAYDIQTNYDTRQKNLADMQAAWQKNPELFKYEDINALMSLTDANYAGFKAGAYQTDMLKPYQDIDDVEKLAQNYKPETSETLSAWEKDGKLYTGKDFKEEVSPELIRADILSNLQNDEELNSYYAQQVAIGNLEAEDYFQMQQDTADRLAEKYGYKKTSKGITSVKNDSRATAQFVHDLSNPLVNATPGSIYDQPILEKYGDVDASGKVVADNSTNGVNTVINKIDTGQSQVRKTVQKLGTDLGIKFTAEQFTALGEGDFAFLANLPGAKGAPLDGQVLLQYQKQYDALQADKQLMEKKLEIAKKRAEESDDYSSADDYLEKMGGKAKMNVIGDYQAIGVVGKNQVKGYDTQVKEYRNELHTSRGWYHQPLKFDAEQIKNLPEELQEKIEDGQSIVDLITNKAIKVEGSPEAEGSGKPLSAMAQYTDALILQAMEDQGIQGSPQGDQGAPVENSYTNFSVNAKHAKPLLGLDGEGKSTIQFEVSIDGYPIRVYLNESAISNKTISTHMNKDVMYAAHKYNEAVSEGVIDEVPYYIDGVAFTKVGKQNVVNGGTESLRNTFQRMAVKYQNDRKRFNKITK